MTLVIGLTGSIASGKSTVSSMLEEMKIPVIDADKVSREVVEPGEEAYLSVVKQFGEDILLPDGNINRKKLGSVIFSNEEKRKILNGIVHPAVRKRMLEQKEDYVQNGESIIVMDIPLLFESQLTHMVDKVIVVFVEEMVQLKRLMERDQSTKEEALQRIHSQIPLKEKVKLADAVINNNGTRAETLKQLKNIVDEWSK